ncbi:penicillin-binding transpeptidase domain-containing protein [Dysosmobacter sp.]|uniref:penicillin-binding transpeptidase domain-containing protein n=1 Tax=Dysosmobacter sp. TaxID=2591382 RepID=UPI002A99D6B1|nr:penicillin-binding transpeptidase domain-containing protein [Dysosmobacter sp.]MDY5613282.1 penicillin-binding transpeptidase domain-containing protein [Dysosmobacter sp.]
MPTNSRRKSDAARRANQVVRSRTMLVMVLLGVCTFLLLLWKLYDLQINRHEELQGRAVNQQTLSAVVTASRGTIYDRGGYVLAASATAETVLLSPRDVAAYVKAQEKAIEDAAEKAAQKGEAYEAPQVRDQAYIARGLSRILGVDQDKIEKWMADTDDAYVEVKKKVEQTEADQVRRFMNGEIDEEGNELTFVNDAGKTVLKANPKKSPTKLQGIWLQPDSKRYYPYSSLAANVLGFVNADNQGGVGLEAKYNNVLEGTAGMTVSAKNAAGTEMLYQFEQYYDAEDGHDLVLTLDVEVQSYLEKGIENMLEKFDAAKGATGIVMDVNSGAIVGMASYPNYDSNQYGMILDTTLQETLDKSLAEIEKNRSSYETEEAYQAAISEARSNAINTAWRNKCIDSTYEPGSTFKPITLAAALEEGLINKNSTFNCTGSVKVGKWTIHCSKKAGHGLQSLEVAVGNSCNPAFINIGQRLGGEKFYEYMQAFGLTEPTGVDMIGETKGIVSKTSLMNDAASLASYSFGQTFNVTPLELIRAQAACINGGYLYTPYVVEQELDGEGAVVYQHESTPVRQVISEETSAMVRECLEYVVASGTGRNGQVAGYRIGGKTGTADKTATRNTTKEVVVSFMCFAPADDPQYIMLLTMDTPSRNTGVYVSGGNMVAPTASSIMADILPVLGVEPDYTAEELAGMDAAVPNVVGKTAADAKPILESAGFSCRTVGDGETVTDQTPAGGAIVPNNATVVLYLGVEKNNTLRIMPNVVGRTASEANKVLADAGLIMKVSGATTASAGNVRAISQSVAEGTELEAGTVVTIQFGDSSVLD